MQVLPSPPPKGLHSFGDYMKDYILEFEDGLGPYWKVFDGNTGWAKKICKTEKEAKDYINMNLSEAFIAYTVAEANCTTNSIAGNVNCFAPCDTVNIPKVNKGCPSKKGQWTHIKGNNPMRYYDEFNDEYVDAPGVPTDDSVKRKYLQGRIYETQSRKNDEFRKAFGLVDDDAPVTAKEFIQRIQDGKFVLKKETEDKNTYRPADNITWRDPAVKEDRAGYDTAWEKFALAVTDATDTVKVAADPADGLKALKALEAWQPK